ncbi:MAG: N-acetylglucosamine-6-phosphate deacetylase [Ruminococcaceae bacterium]|nr:N-acetylglucosamine-6-phosphate deacetylase [Oscillospiraceae bacterium]
MLTIFKNGFVYSDALHQFIRTDILVKDGIIEKLDISITDSADQIIDCTGLFIMPGLVDVHTHGRSGYDFNTADSDGCREMRKAYAKVGTTTVMATLASAEHDELIKSITAINENRPSEPGIATFAGTHLEGRYLSQKRRGAHHESLLAPLDKDELKDFITRMLPLPVHISAAAELEGGEEFVKTAKILGATFGLAHSDATYDEAMKAVEWGVTSFTHTYNAMRPLHHREPGNIAASLMCDSAYTELICDGEHVHPTMIKLASRTKPADKVVLITDSMEAAGCPDGEYSIAGLPVFVKNGRAVNSEGALSGSTLNLFTALKNYMKFTGKTLEDALPCATSNPAAMVGIENTCGSIKEGLRADFIIIKDKTDPEIDSVWAFGAKV